MLLRRYSYHRGSEKYVLPWLRSVSSSSLASSLPMNTCAEVISEVAGCPAHLTTNSDGLRGANEMNVGPREVSPQQKGRYGVISLFGVFSVVPLFKKKIGYSPVVIVLAENNHLRIEKLFVPSLFIAVTRSGVILLKVVRHCSSCFSKRNQPRVGR